MWALKVWKLTFFLKNNPQGKFWKTWHLMIWHSFIYIYIYIHIYTHIYTYLWNNCHNTYMYEWMYIYKILILKYKCTYKIVFVFIILNYSYRLYIHKGCYRNLKIIIYPLWSKIKSWHDIFSIYVNSHSVN